MVVDGGEYDEGSEDVECGDLPMAEGQEPDEEVKVGRQTIEPTASYAAST